MEEKQRFTGKNEDQAKERAARVLGIPQTELNWTLVSKEKGFLGMGGSATIEVVVPSVPPAPVTPAPAPADKQGEPEIGNERTSSPRGQRDGRRDGQRDGQRDGRRRDGGRRDGGRRDSGRERSRPRRDDGPMDEAEFGLRIARAEEVSHDLLKQMGWETGVTVSRHGQDRIMVKVNDDAADLADDGRDLIDAYQFLLNKIVNRFPPRYRIIVDVAGMLDKFDAELTRRAKEWCQEVIDTGEEFWIEEELNPRDRRIVHIEVKLHEGIDSRSEGMGRDRRICIFSV